MTTPAAREAVKARYDAVLARERRQARALALALFPLERISVWEVVVLPLLVMSYLRQRQVRDLFVENFLFTKRLALAGALDLARGDRSREGVRARIRERTTEVLRSTPGDLYSAEIREAQLEEIEALLDHDLRLLEARGEDHAALVRSAYRDRREYEAWLARLAERERAVSAASVRTLGAKGDRALAERMDEIARTIRAREAERIYGPPAGGGVR